MRILVACELPEAALEELRGLAVDLTYRPHASATELRDQIGDAGVLIIGATRVSPETIAQARALQMIVHAGGGPGDVALEEASAQGIFVSHCPDTHATALAELALGLMLALDRRIVELATALREGRWARAEAAAARGLAGRTLGLLGYGAAGRLLARRAAAFELRVIAWLPPTIAEARPEPPVELCNWPRELARASDVVVVLPVEGESEPLVDELFLESMPYGAALIQLGHAGAVDEPALYKAAQSGRVRVALDVFASEPAADVARFRSRLCELPNVIGTPHIGALTEQARRATADEVVRVVRSFVVSGEVHNCLNLCERSPATWQLVLRVRDQPGAMAAILDAIRADGINAEEITSRVFTGAKAAWCVVALDERPSTEALGVIRALPGVLHLELRAVV